MSRSADTLIIDLFHLALGPPVVENTAITGITGESLTLLCSYSFPPNLVRAPDVQWLHSNGTVYSYDDTLTFDPLRTSYGGEYMCCVRISIPQLSIVGLMGVGSIDLIVLSEWQLQICMCHICAVYNVSYSCI